MIEGRANGEWPVRAVQSVAPSDHQSQAGPAVVHQSLDPGEQIARLDMWDAVQHDRDRGAGPGDDTVDAGPGDDKINAGPGNDLIDGGPGTDTCVQGGVVIQCE